MKWMIAALVLLSACGGVGGTYGEWETITDPETGVQFRCIQTDAAPLCYRP